MNIDIDKIFVYLPSHVLTCEMSNAEYKEALAEKLYEEYVCDRRLDPEDVIQLLLYACNKHGV